MSWASTKVDLSQFLSERQKGERDAKAVLKNKFLPTTDCELAKKHLSQLSVKIEELATKSISSKYHAGSLTIYDNRYKAVESKYNQNNCDLFISNKKADLVRDIVDRENLEAESVVGAQTKKQNTIIIGVGATIMLIGLLVIIKKG